VSIKLAESNIQILGCFPVMSQLRPHLDEAKFIEQVRYQMKEGYQIAFLEIEKQTVAELLDFAFIRLYHRGKFYILMI
jgi:hypothetical protein